MKWILFFTSISCLLACGHHEQYLMRSTNSQEETKINEEGDLELALETAVGAGDINKIKSLVSQGVSLNILSKAGLTLPMVAIMNRQYATLEYLVENGIDLDLKSSSEEVQPDVTVFEYNMASSSTDKVKSIVGSILNREELPVSILEENIFTAVEDKDYFMVKWLLEKGVSPNTIRRLSSGKEKDTPLIFLFTLLGVQGDVFVEFKKVFDLLISHPDIDVNLEVRKRTPLINAKKRAKENPKDFQPLVDQLIAMGAK